MFKAIKGGGGWTSFRMFSLVPFYKKEKLGQSSPADFPSCLIALNNATTSSRTAGKEAKF